MTVLVAPDLPFLAISDRQDLFATGIVVAIIGTAGYNISRDWLDRRKTDLEIRLPDVQNEINPLMELPQWELLRIQVKCTYAHDIGRDGAIPYQVDRETHKFLCSTHGSPRILVLVHVPRPGVNDSLSWITMNTDHTVVRNRVYWASFYGNKPIDDVERPTVRVPTANVFDVAAVQTLMQRIVVQGDKRYAG